MCKGNCRECKHLQIPCRAGSNYIACCFECDKYGILSDSIAEMLPTVLDELGSEEWQEAKQVG